MHRDIARLLVLLATVRVLTVAACPAPAPQPRLIHRESDRQLRHHVTTRKPPLPRPNRDPATTNRDSDPASDRWGFTRPAAARPTQRTPSQLPARRAAVAIVACFSAEPHGTTNGGPLESPTRRPTQTAAPQTVDPSPPPPARSRPHAGPARSGGRRPQRRGARDRRGRGTGDRRPDSVHPAPAPSSSTGLAIGALNVQSIKPKLLELTDEISRQNLDVLLLSETWLRPSTPNRLLVIPGYNSSRVDRPDGRGYGGVAIVTKANLTPMALKLPVSQCSDSLLESQWALLKLPKNRKLIVCSIYRPLRSRTACRFRRPRDTTATHPDRPPPRSLSSYAVTLTVIC